MSAETYTVTPETGGQGMFFFTDCGNRMFSTGDGMTYHGTLCPKCLISGKQVTLYIRGSKEAEAMNGQKGKYHG